MRKTLIVFLLLLGSMVYAQDRKPQRYDTPEKYNIIKINPLSLILTNFSFSYERILTEKIGLQLQAGYWFGAKVYGTDWSGYSFTPEVRYYITRQERPEGLYASVFGRYQQVKTLVEKSNSTLAISRIGGGIAVGYQFLFGERITWDLFLGPQYLVNSGSKDDISTAEYGQFIGNFGLRVGTTLGVAF